MLVGGGKDAEQAGCKRGEAGTLRGRYTTIGNYLLSLEDASGTAAWHMSFTLGVKELTKRCFQSLANQDPDHPAEPSSIAWSFLPRTWRLHITSVYHHAFVKHTTLCYLSNMCTIINKLTTVFRRENTSLPHTLSNPFAVQTSTPPCTPPVTPQTAQAALQRTHATLAAALDNHVAFTEIAYTQWQQAIQKEDVENIVRISFLRSYGDVVLIKCSKSGRNSIERGRKWRRGGGRTLRSRGGG
jgi:hypothetical protein